MRRLLLRGAFWACECEFYSRGCSCVWSPAFLYSDDVTSSNPTLVQEPTARWDRKTLAPGVAKKDHGRRKVFASASRAGHGNLLTWGAGSEGPSIMKQASDRAANAHMFREQRF